MTSASTKHKVAIVMGSKSDYATMKNCEKILRLLKVKFETKIVSAHRTPERMFKFAKAAALANLNILSGVRCAETILVSNLTFSNLKIFSQFFMVA